MEVRWRDERPGHREGSWAQDNRDGNHQHVTAFKSTQDRTGSPRERLGGGARRFGGGGGGETDRSLAWGMQRPEAERVSLEGLFGG